MIIKKLFIVLALPLVIVANSAHAVSIGGYNVSAFANSLDAVAPPAAALDVVTVGGTLAGVTTDASVDSFVRLPSGTASSTISLTLGFLPGTLVNGVGDDLVLFEIGVPDDFTVSIDGSATQTLATTFTGSTISGGLALNALAIDLSTFGFALDAEIAQVTIDLFEGGATFAMAGALAAPVPVPAAIWLFGSGLLAFAGFARRKA